MRELNLDQLRTLITVVELGGFSRAAERLHLSQSAVSLQIRELETRLGLRLVDRLGRRARASAAGADVIARAREALEATRRVTEAARRHHEGFVGRVRIGTGVSMLTWLLPPVLARLLRAHPGLELELSVGNAAEMRRRLVDNDIDVGVLAAPAPERELCTSVLRTDPLWAVLPPSARDAPRTITPAQLVRHPLVIEGDTRVDALALQWLRDGGIEPRPAMRVGNVEAIKRVVAAGLGAAVLAAESIPAERERRGLVVRPLRPALRRTLLLAVRRGKPPDAALTIVVEAIETGLQAPARAGGAGGRRTAATAAARR